MKLRYICCGAYHSFVILGNKFLYFDVREDDNFIFEEFEKAYIE